MIRFKLFPDVQLEYVCHLVFPHLFLHELCVHLTPASRVYPHDNVGIPISTAVQNTLMTYR
jgi:hypothetical protein